MITRNNFINKKTTSTSLVLILSLASTLASAESKILPTITVTEKEDANFIDGYKADVSRSSTRTQTPLLDTPQSISVITPDQIRDQNITSVSEAIRYVPGIVTQQGESNRDQITIRGNTSNADFFIDGARDDAQYFRDFYNIESIEVLKGPNALAFGRGGSGGLINRVSKTADGSRVRQVVASGGSFDNRRIQGDVGDRINDAVSVRFNAMYEKSGTFRDHGNLEKYGFNPTVNFDFSKNTSLLAGYEYFYDNRFNDRGIPSSNGLAFKTNPKTFFGNPEQNNASAAINSGYTILNHNFSSTLKLKNHTRYTQNDVYYQNVFANKAVDSAGNVELAAYKNDAKRNSFTNQTDLTKKFEIGATKHTALFGTEITRQDSEALRQRGFFNNNLEFEIVNVSNPISLTPITYRFKTGSTDPDNHSSVKVYAAYLQDQIDINKYLQITGGLRYDRFEIDLHNNQTGTNLSSIDGMISPRVGIVVKPIEELSIYGNYNVSFLPNSGDQFSSLNDQIKGLEPEELENKEIGVKWDVNPKINLSAAIYQLDRTNTRANDPSNPGNFVLTGESRTRGLELGAAGKITDKWQVIAAYAFQDAVITSTTSAAPAGKKIALVPHNMGSIWNKYDFTPQLAAAIGVVSQSDQFAEVDNKVRLKGFTRFDGAVYYKINPSYRVQLNVENILGREYIQTAHNNNNIQPGSPRAFRVSLTANF